MRSRRYHYEEAERALDKIAEITKAVAEFKMRGDVADQAADYLLRIAHVHATLATVPVAIAGMGGGVPDVAE